MPPLGLRSCRRLTTQFNIHSPSKRLHSTSPAPSLLKNKKCIITGASRGIGAAIALRLASEGATCILIGRNDMLLQSIKSQLPVSGTDDPATEHKIITGDISQPTFWDTIRKSEKDISILINAAGVTHSSPLFTTSLSTLQANVDTNLMGTLYACRAIGKEMMRSKQGGVIVNVASLLGVKGGRGSVGYAASKAGVVGLTRALAAEVGAKGIRVNALLPGYIETDMTRAMTPEARTTALSSIPQGRFGTPSEVADAAFFLATNPYANNCVLNLDGGLSAV